MSNTPYRACAAAMAFAFTLQPRPADADTVWLKDGSIVKGEILEITDDDLKIDTDFADEIAIDLGDIDSMRSTREMTITYSDDSERTGYLRKYPDGRVYLSDAPPPAPAPAAAAPSAAPTADEAAAVTAVAAGADAPPTADEVSADDLLDLSAIHKMEQKKTYFWYKSNIDLGIGGASGNSDTANGNISGAIRPRFGKNLIDIDGQANKQESDGTTNASNWRTQLMYTRELTTRWGATGFVSFENDEKQDLSLRTTLGAGVSRLIVDTSKTYLDGFLGLAYVNEGYEQCDPFLDPPINTVPNPNCTPQDLLEFESSRSYGAVRWQANFNQDVWSDDIQFYHNHRLTIGVIQESQFIALTTTGIDFDIFGDFSLKLELQFDYNSDPASSNAEKQDVRYFVKLGYDFEGDQNDWFK